MQKMLDNKYGTFTHIKHLFIDAEHKKYSVMAWVMKWYLLQLSVKYFSIYMKIGSDFNERTFF